MLIKWSLSDIIRGSISDNENIKDFMDAIHKKYKKLEKVELANLESSFMKTKYENIGGVRNFVLKKI